LLFPFWTILGEWEHWVAWILLGIAVVLTAVSGVDFFVKYQQQNRRAT
jgi:hypothetical protein